MFPISNIICLTERAKKDFMNVKHFSQMFYQCMEPKCPVPEGVNLKVTPRSSQGHYDSQGHLSHMASLKRGSDQEEWSHDMATAWWCHY